MQRDTKWTGFYVKHDAEDDAIEFGPEPSRTRQEFAAECDINTIMERYETHGVISHIDQREPMYVDVTELPHDLADAMQILHGAEEAFMSLPASVRKEMDNDVYKFVDYAGDPANLEQMRKWGLAPPAPVPDAPLEVRVVPDPAPPGPPPATP